MLAGDLPTFLSPGVDAEMYRAWAERILSGVPQGEPFFRGPLYPYLIATLGRVFFGDTFWTIRVFQILVSAIAAGALASLAFRWYSYTAGWIAGLGWAFYGLSIYFDAEGLITSLFTSGLILLLLWIDLYQRKARIHWIILAAITLGCMTLLRANALILWPVLLWALASRPGAKRRKRTHPTWVAPLLAGTILIAMAVPITSYNHSRGGGWTISTQGGINLYLGNNPAADGAYAVDPEFGPAWTRAQIEYRAAQAVGKTRIAKTETDSYYTNQAMRYWLDNTWDAIKLTLKKALIFFNFRELGNNRPLQPFLMEVSPLFAFLALIGFPLIAIFGLPFIPKSWQYVANSRPAIVMFGLYFLSLLAFFINARYRFPITPILVLLAAGSLADFSNWLKRVKEEKQKAWFQIGVRVAVALLVLLPKPVSTAGMDENWRFHQAAARLRLTGLIGENQPPSEAIAYEKRRTWTMEAQEILLELTEKGSQRENVHLNLGLTYMAQNKPARAKQQFEMEIAANANRSGATNNLGVIAQRRGQLDKAEALYRRSLSLDPTNPDAIHNLAALLNETARVGFDSVQVQQTYERLQEAVRLVPNNPTYLINLAMVEVYLGEHHNAINHLYRVLQLNPNSTTARQMLRDLGVVLDSSEPSRSSNAEE